MKSKLPLKAICGASLVFLSTAAGAETPQSSIDNLSASVEATLADLKSRIEQLEYRVGGPSTFQGRGVLARAARGASN
jgi:hypothetical protein